MPISGSLSRRWAAQGGLSATPRLERTGASYKSFAAWQPVRLLGRGRATIVFQARPIHSTPDSPADYVIKTIAAEYLDDPLALASLRREAKVAAELSHPNLPVLLASQLHRSPYHLAFLHERAVSSRRLLQPPRNEQGDSPRGLRIPQALWIARQVAEGLHALHEAGWLHGDIKPDNLLVTPQGRATLIDFGFARRLDGEECSFNEPLAGSCIYTPPEMIVPQGSLTTTSDVYSLGVTLFELLTGRPPMETTSRSAIVSWHLRSVAPELRSILPHAPLRLARLLRAMLARQPLRRPSVSELIQWLAELEIDTLAMR